MQYETISGAPDLAVRGDVAIVGLACTYPGARRMEQFWQNIVNKVDAITDVDPGNWDPDTFFDPDPNNANDRLYSKKGGWLPNTYTFNPLKFGIPPAAIAGAEPDHFLLLRCVYEALEDAGYMKRSFNRERTSVIVGKGNYVGPGQIWLAMRSTVMEGVMRVIRHVRPDLSEEQVQKLRESLKAKLPRLTPESAAGVIPNISTGRVANRLDLMGQNYSVDAACASTLIAAEIAVRNLLTGVDDMTLIGGLHISNQVPFLSIFKVTRAISLSSVMKPFDAKADGTMSGEGVGMLVLKRLADAERDGDRIYAVIKGVGSSSDGKAKGVMAPRVEGEILAIRRALDMAQIPPDSVGLVECHGTATVVGDAVEIESLETAYGPADPRGPSCAIGSVKSMIGHTMPAAGAASLIKTALSLYHRVLPPTLNVTEPHPKLQEKDCRFYVNSETKPWIHRTDAAPRRAGVNAFGFGGINVHVLLEEYTKSDENSLPSHLREWPTEVIVVEGASRAQLLESLAKLRNYVMQVEGVALRDVAYTLNTSLTNAPCRVAIVASSFEDLAQKIDRVSRRLGDPECTQLRERSGLYYFENPELRNGKLAMLFPGEGAQYLNMMADLCIHFPEVRKCFDHGDAAVKDPLRTPLSTLVYPPPMFSDEEEQAADARLWSLEHGTETVLTADWAMLALTWSLGIKPDMMTGHSVGDWLAMAASGMLEGEEFFANMDRLDGIYKKVLENTGIPKMTMLAVGAGREKILAMASQFGCEVEIANDNCPHQVVAVMKPERSQAFVDHLLKNGVFVERLPYDGGYHTPSFTYMGEPLLEFFKNLKIQPPKLPVYCGMTTLPWPDKPEEILDIAADTFARPILFTQTIEKMYEDGARIFLEAGPRGNLTAFVDDILRGKPHLTVPLDVFRRPSLTALNHAVGMLAANHVPLDFNPLYKRRTPIKLAMDVKADSVLPEERQPGMIQISKIYTVIEPPDGPSEFPMPEAAIAPEPRPVKPEITTEVPVAMNGHSAPVLHQPEPMPVMAAQPVYAASAPASAGVALSPSVPASAIQDHFTLMEEFLQAQEEIMSQMLGGGLLAVAPAPEAHFAQPAPAPVVYAEPVPEALPAPAPIPEPVSPANPAPAPAVPAPSGPNLQALLLQVVSERTGYPAEMLDLDQDMEADLGIDSIKRVEIFGALRELGGGAALGGDGDMEAVGKLKTLRQIIAFLGEKSPAPAAATVSAEAVPEPKALAAAGTDLRPLIHTAKTIEEVAGQSVTVRLSLDLNEHPYLRDHCLCFAATDYNNQGNRTYVMPLTGCVELACEAASLLEPGQLVVGVSGVDIFRPLQAVENEAPPVIQLVAKKQPSGEVKVMIREDSAPGAKFGNTYSQATIHFAPAYPAAPQAEELTLENQRKPNCSGKDIYTLRHMFHGPSFQGVNALDSMGDNGLLAKLEILPTDGRLKSVAHPNFHIDPFLLDAAGQLVGYWPIENCGRGYVVLPIRVAKVNKYSENPPAGTILTCRLHVRNVAQRTLRADYDVILPDGRVWLRITGWEDWRFYWQPRMFDYGRFPKTKLASVPVAVPDLDKAGFACVLLPPMGDHERDSVSDENWAQVLLSRRELAEFRKLSAHKQSEWLFTRSAAKDAARSYTTRVHNRQLCPADIELTTDGGATQVSGPWTGELPAPQVSAIYHQGWAVGVAGPQQSAVAAMDLGEAIPGNYFLPDEEDMLGRLEGADEWKKRAAIAKQAAGRYFRPEAGEEYWQTLLVATIDANKGWFGIADPSSAVNAEDALRVVTAREGDTIVAVAFQL